MKSKIVKAILILSTITLMTIPCFSDPLEIMYMEKTIPEEQLRNVQKAADSFNDITLDILNNYGYKNIIVYPDRLPNENTEVYGVTIDNPDGKYILVSAMAPNIEHVTRHEIAHAIDHAFGNISKNEASLFYTEYSSWVTGISQSEWWAESLAYSFEEDNKDLNERLMPGFNYYVSKFKRVN